MIAHPPTSSFKALGPTALTFSPKGDAESLCVTTINSAGVTLYVQAFEFSSQPICDAIITAHKRGVAVSVLLDKKNRNIITKWLDVVGRHSLYPQLKAAGVQVLFDDSALIAHSKVLIIDDETVVTGSFNFSGAAQKSNAENLLVIRDKSLASAYLINFAWRQSLSKP